MGDVYCVLDSELNRKAALKILSRRHLNNQELHGRFVREARSVAAISHPNVVQVFTTGNYDNRPYILMELLDGVDLGNSVSTHGPWTSLAAASAIRDAALGLSAAAAAGLIHRDVKPTNLVQIKSGAIKVTDFGLVRPKDPALEPTLTARGVVVGTPDYIAPEQARGEVIDERVDIYALGGTLYFLLIGMPPFRTGNVEDDEYLKVVARHINEPPPNPFTRSEPWRRGGQTSVDEELANLTVQLMSKNRDLRPNYQQLVDHLDAIIARLQAQSDQAKTISPTDRASVSENSSEANASTAHLKRPLWPIIVTSISAAIFASGLALTLFGPSKSLGSPPPLQDSAIQAANPTTAQNETIGIPNAQGEVTVAIDRQVVPQRAYDSGKLPFAQTNQLTQTNQKPVTGISFSEATAYAQKLNKRLPLIREWKHAATNKQLLLPTEKLEWVLGENGNPVAINANGLVETPPPDDYPNITFRLAQDL